MYFSKKGIRSVPRGLGQSLRSCGIFENVCVKNNLTVCKVNFNFKLQKKLGEQDVLVALPITTKMTAHFSCTKGTPK